MNVGKWARRPISPGRAVVVLALAAVVAGAACSSPSGPTGPVVTPPNPFVLVGAGDIALCGSPGPEATARLLDDIGGEVFTAGDNAYPSGTMADFRDCYDPTWGRHKGRTHPTPGNHDYETAGAQGYYDYFGDNAGSPGFGYYTYKVGEWRVIALNSEINAQGQTPSAGGSAAQLQWLKNELATNAVPCTIAIWHRPLFSSGPNRPQTDMRDIFKALYDGNADIVLNGHEHLYERFAPQDSTGRADSARGIRQFTVGTGGVPLYQALPAQPNSETIQSVWGVLKLTLGTGSYSWDFIPVRGSSGSHDTGNGVCH